MVSKYVLNKYVLFAGCTTSTECRHGKCKGGGDCRECCDDGEWVKACKSEKSTKKETTLLACKRKYGTRCKLSEGTDFIRDILNPFGAQPGESGNNTAKSVEPKRKLVEVPVTVPVYYLVNVTIPVNVTKIVFINASNVPHITRAITNFTTNVLNVT